MRGFSALERGVEMKITVVGVAILIGSILLLAIALEHLNRKLNESGKPTQDRGNDEQANAASE